MTGSRKALLERLAAFRLAVSSEHLVTKAPTELDHNARAALLRSGLAVVGFAALEDFIKSRSGEVLSRLGTSGASFTQLPKPIRTAATSGVIAALKYQERYLDEPLVMAFHQRHAELIASTARSAYGVSTLAFANAQSNLQSQDVADVLEAFQVDNAWNAIGSISRRIGLGVLALKPAFDSAAARRHRAAHRPDAVVENSELQSYALEVLALAVGFDLLLSYALRRILDAHPGYLRGDRLAAKEVKLRFVRDGGRGPKQFSEIAEGMSRAARRGTDLDDVVRTALPRARANGEALVVLDRKGIPSSWYTPFVD